MLLLLKTYARSGKKKAKQDDAMDVDDDGNDTEPAEDDEDTQEWGLEKGMELFEVSAKDDVGMWLCGPTLSYVSAQMN